jgi:hypothetical protein
VAVLPSGLSRKVTACALYSSFPPNTRLNSTIQTLKGQYHEIFDPRLFSLNGTPGSPDSWAKRVENLVILSL